jgi:tRNA wybutosine-synthesizing protein 2
LIPSSELSWPTACQALKKDTGGYLHIHGNVDSSPNNTISTEDNKAIQGNKKHLPEWIKWSEYTCHKLKEIFNQFDLKRNWSVSCTHIEHVKSYGPHVDHLVLDVLCKPEIIK